MIVMGSHGHGAFAGVVIGSVTTKVLATATVPVLVIRSNERKAEHIRGNTVAHRSLKTVLQSDQIRD